MTQAEQVLRQVGNVRIVQWTKTTYAVQAKLGGFWGVGVFTGNWEQANDWVEYIQNNLNLDLYPYTGLA